MGFWIFILLTNLLIPIAMIVCGYFFQRKVPRNMNGCCGYRTKRSTKSKETWEFAHHYFGRLWFRWGVFTFVITILLMLFVLGKDMGTIGIYGGAVCMLQMIPMILPIFLTEHELKKKFDL